MRTADGSKNTSDAARTTADVRPHGPDTDHSILLELQDSKALLAAAQRLARVRGWAYDVASGCLQWLSDTGSAGPTAQASALSLTTFFERIHPEDRYDMLRLSQEVLRDRRAFTFRFRFLGTDGNLRSVSGDGEALACPDGQVRRVVGWVMDVSAYDGAREPRVHGDPRTPGLEASSSVWLWEQDEELRFTSLTRTQDEDLNEKHESVIGKRRWESPGALPCNGTWEDHKQLLQRRRAFHDFEYRVRMPSGEERVFSTSGAPSHAANGEFVGYRGVTSDITPLKEAQANASRSQELLRMASRLGQVAAWAVDFPNMEGSWSSELFTLYEFESHQHVTVELLNSLIAADQRQAVSDVMHACYTQGTSVDIEFPSLTAKGNQVWLRLRAEAIRDSAGSIVRVQGAVQDITERKRDAERLRALNQSLTTTLESITDGFMTVDRELRPTYINGEAERQLGLSRAELLGQSLAERFPAFQESEFRREFHRALVEGTAGTVEAFSPTLRRWLNVAVFPSGQGLALYIRDVTESRQAQRKLVLSEERYRLLFETSADGILKVRPDGRIRRANRAACEMFVRTEAQMQKLLSRQLVWPDDSRLEPMVRQRLHSGGARGELTMLRADGSTFEAEVNTSTFNDANGQTFVNIVIRDATERIQLRQKLMALNDELAEKVRQRTQELERANSELSGFARSLAHDLRQPVTAAKSFGIALQMSLAKGDVGRARQYAGQLNESTQWVGNYVEALLSLTRISRATLVVEEVDLTALASGLLEELKRQYPDRHVAAVIQPGLQAKGDPTLLRLLLQNLLSNAWKFTGRKDLARISFSAATSPHGEVVYAVEDNGAGFDMSRADRLFETFQRFHKTSEFPGTGIGLANAHRIVQRHGGRIWAESEPGQGAKFFLTLAAPGNPAREVP